MPDDARLTPAVRPATSIAPSAASTAAPPASSAASTAGPAAPADCPFHPGELPAQQLAGGGSAGGAIRSFMPDQHRRFFAQLPFIAVATTDAGGPIATLWTGRPGFVASPDPHTLRIAVALDP